MFEILEPCRVLRLGTSSKKNNNKTNKKKNLEYIEESWAFVLNDQVGNIREVVFMLSSRIDNPFCKYINFPKDMIERVHIIV